MFGQTKPPDVNELRFTTKADAFAYMLRYQISEKEMDPLEAAQKANEFANIFAENAIDLAEAEKENLAFPLLKRLKFDEKKINV